MLREEREGYKNNIIISSCSANLYTLIPWSWSLDVTLSHSLLSLILFLAHFSSMKCTSLLFGVLCWKCLAIWSRYWNDFSVIHFWPPPFLLRPFSLIPPAIFSPLASLSLIKDVLTLFPSLHYLTLLRIWSKLDWILWESSYLISIYSLQSLLAFILSNIDCNRSLPPQLLKIILLNSSLLIQSDFSLTSSLISYFLPSLFDLSLVRQCKRMGRIERLNEFSLPHIPSGLALIRAWLSR